MIRSLLKKYRSENSFDKELSALPEIYLDAYKAIHDQCAPGVEMSCKKAIRTYHVYQTLLHLKATHSECVSAEFGVFRGQKSKLISEIFNRPSDEHHIFDSFEGLSSASREDKQKKDTFGMMSPDEQHIRNILPKATLHRGWIPQDLTDLPVKFIFAHIDLDLYEPVKGALDWLDSRMKANGIIIIDDYNTKWPGCMKAVSEFCAKHRTKLSLTLDTREGNFIIVYK